MTDERQRGAATALALGMLETAIKAQRDGGTIVDVVVEIDQQSARVLGFAGEGSVTLRLWPCKPVDMQARWRDD